jgi:mannose-1-phosphate guanylyltransferase / mannose-6-phosphate isomerase
METIRPWGYYRVLHDVDGTKVKELVVNPGCSLSMQRHNFRSEHWHVAEGSAEVYTMIGEGNSAISIPLATLNKYQFIHIHQGQWHQLRNPFPKHLQIIEIQYGEKCVEYDIERYFIEEMVNYDKLSSSH